MAPLDSTPLSDSVPDEMEIDPEAEEVIWRLCMRLERASKQSANDASAAASPLHDQKPQAVSPSSAWMTG